MATAKKFVPFEKSKADKEPKGMKEGSKKEEAMDKRQKVAAKMPKAPQGPMGFKNGGMIKGKKC